MIPRALLAALLSSPLAAQVRVAPPGAIPPVLGAGLKAAPAQDAVLGVFEGESDTLFWFERDARAGLMSKGVAEHIAKTPKAGARKVGDMLRTTGGGWLVLRDPASGLEHFTFFDGGVYYLPVAAQMKLGSGELPRTGLEVQGDSLLAVYGSPKDGSVGLKRLSPTKKGSEATAGVFAYEGGALVEGVVADKGALDTLLKDARLAEAAKALAAEAEGGSALTKIQAFLDGGAARVVTLNINKSGKALFKLRENEKDTAYVYASAAGARVLPIGD